MTRGLLILTLAAGILASACSALPSEPRSIEQYIQNQKSAAVKLQQEDRLAESLAYWQSLQPVAPDDPEVSDAVKSVEDAIRERVDLNLDRADFAYQNGNPKQGDFYMLKVLALAPGHTEAMAHLRKSHSAQAHARMGEKNSSENRAIVRRESDVQARANRRLHALYMEREFASMVALGETMSTGIDPDMARLLRNAHIMLADQAEYEGELDTALAHMQSAMALQPLENDPLLDRTVTIRKRLSLLWYEEGVRLLDNDRMLAIEALERSLVYNPYNNPAKEKLLWMESQ